jgi:cell fate (sporulation/competence/biofilm development) regulator YlbF (YheA/YmcA/DUF963 family)
MDCCSPTSAAPMALEYAPEIDHSADELASLLAQAPEYQEFIRLAQLINLDPDVKRISMEIRNRQMFYVDAEDKSVEALQAELETLPAVQAYRKVEAAVKDLFHSVDQAISEAAGVEFAPNALPRACG